MIRVDGIGKFDFDYEEIAEALGWADFGNDDFEEIMSTHYGRMVVLDDRVIMFANPEDAAEYIDFDLKPSRRRTSHVREGRREVLRRWTATSTSGTRVPENWVKGAGAVRQGLDRVLPRLQGLGAARDALVDREVPEVLRRSDFVKDVFEDGHVDVGVFQSTYLKEWYTTGFNTTETNAEMAAKHPDKLIVNGRFDPRDGDPGLRQLEEDHADATASRA